MFLWLGDGAPAEASRFLDLAKGAGDRPSRRHWLMVTRYLDALVQRVEVHGGRPQIGQDADAGARSALIDIAESFIHVCNGDDHRTSIHNIEARIRQIADVIGTDADYAVITRLFLQRCKSISATSREERRSASVYTAEIVAAARDLLRLRRHVSRVLA